MSDERACRFLSMRAVRVQMTLTLKIPTMHSGSCLELRYETTGIVVFSIATAFDECACVLFIQTENAVVHFVRTSSYLQYIGEHSPYLRIIRCLVKYEAYQLASTALFTHDTIYNPALFLRNVLHIFSCNDNIVKCANRHYTRSRSPHFHTYTSYYIQLVVVSSYCSPYLY